MAQPTQSLASAVADQEDHVSHDDLSRAEFLTIMGAAGLGLIPGAAALLDPLAGPDAAAAQVARQDPYISVAVGRSLNGSHVAAVTRTAIRNLGGMGRFVHKGDDVIVKPNIYGTRTPAMACTTNPTVVATVIRECLKAGARRVRVMDLPCGGGAAESYRMSGIQQAAKAAGGKAVLMSSSRFREYRIPKGRALRSMGVYRDIMQCDVLIDVPIAKVHGGGQISMACKNLMGCVSRPGEMHGALHQAIPDLLSLIRPELVVIDGTRVRVADGPGGTSLNDVRKRYTVIASTDAVAADSYAVRHLLGRDPDGIAQLVNARRMGIGRTDLAALSTKRVKL